MNACATSRLNCTCLESATLTGGDEAVTFDNGAWCAQNWDPIKSMAIRGGDLLVPDVDYVLPRRRYLDKIGPVSIQMIFDGNVDASGTSYAPATVQEGLELNRRDFIDNAVVPPATTDNLFTFTITMADGTDFTGPLHVEDFLWSNVAQPGTAVAVWRISLPLGLTVVPSP